MPKDLLHELKDYVQEKGWLIKVAYAGQIERTICAVFRLEPKVGTFILSDDLDEAKKRLNDMAQKWPSLVGGK